MARVNRIVILSKWKSTLKRQIAKEDIIKPITGPRLRTYRIRRNMRKDKYTVPTSIEG
jgi:hypothetical protein